MAGLSPITADTGCKPVQKMVKDGDEMPEEYVCKDFHYGTIDDDVPIMDISIVDLKVLTSSSASRREELGKLKSALTSWGYFQAINSGIEESLVDEVRKVSRQFFDLSMEEKQKYGRALDDTEGYGNDMVLSENLLPENHKLLIGLTDCISWFIQKTSESLSIGQKIRSHLGILSITVFTFRK
ncbi:hypothetical protein CQW23_16496 [Capsicum baccatum]|uniref:Non-haem dioxygenase N-terminal domain-containing protein n=1 Tax=Capsicum baccatum TaxID=33114 RepID=A0A2G2WB42_CAPBA|nr:hypothetical protein CQW23_16496 [Capsicum baccatum]